MTSTQQSDRARGRNASGLSRDERAERLRLIAACLATAKAELAAAIAHLEAVQR